MPKPTIVLVPGSFCAPGVYTEVVRKLRAKGFPALQTVLPSTQKRLGLEPATMYDDAKHIRSLAETLIGQGKEVVIMCHSYGGTPTSEGLAGVPVKRIVYLTAIVPKVGENHGDAMDSPTVQMLVDSSVGGYMHLDPVASASGFSDEMPFDLAYEAALQLPHHSAVSFTNKVTQIAYDKVPVSYIFTEKDRVVSAELQKKFVKILKEAQGKQINVIRKPWGHFPNWTFPEELAQILAEEAEK